MLKRVQMGSHGLIPPSGKCSWPALSCVSRGLSYSGTLSRRTILHGKPGMSSLAPEMVAQRGSRCGAGGKTLTQTG
ncbi:hypothetical protein Taro_048237 [Colocasia esculenta]|uniref:Uncharacterized protein n=1 Tax=Colocasia esculenta TaxID=4460 RepID=A0A843WV92_COLES|nr:hypothetical protein [Colocasia esculenta]